MNIIVLQILSKNTLHHVTINTFPNAIYFKVYGVPDDRMGEEVCASVIVNEDSTVTEADIKLFSKGKVSFH